MTKLPSQTISHLLFLYYLNPTHLPRPYPFSKTLSPLTLSCSPTTLTFHTTQQRGEKGVRERGGGGRTYRGEDDGGLTLAASATKVDLVSLSLSVGLLFFFFCRLTVVVMTMVNRSTLSISLSIDLFTLFFVLSFFFADLLLPRQWWTFLLIENHSAKDAEAVVNRRFPLRPGKENDDSGGSVPTCGGEDDDDVGEEEDDDDAGEEEDGDSQICFFSSCSFVFFSLSPPSSSSPAPLAPPLFSSSYDFWICKNTEKLS